MSGVKLKICGVISTNEAKIVLNAKVDYVSLNFIKGSSRCISIETAESIIGILKESHIKTVALFRDQPLDFVNGYSEKLNVDFVQLHGNESITYTLDVNKPIIKAIPVNSSVNPETIIDFVANYPAKYFVLDREKQGEGDMVNLHVARRIIRECPGKIFVAGGLNADNLEGTLAKTHPFGIDIASGVRTNNTLDITKVNEVIRIINVD